jgi:hypothetical protein
MTETFAADSPGEGDATRGANAATSTDGSVVAAPASPASDDERRVAEALERLRSGVRQRRAEATTLAGTTAETHTRLLVLREREYLHEPVPFSHRPRWGQWIVFARKVVHQLFGRWMLRPVLAQQSEFNHAAAGLLQELAEGQERQARRLAELSARLEALERAAGERPSDPGASPG